MKFWRWLGSLLAFAVVLAFVLGNPIAWGQAALIMWDVAAGGKPTLWQDLTARPTDTVRRWQDGEGDLYQPAGKMEEFFRELGKPPKDLITAEQMVEKTYTEEQVKSLRRLFETHGMDLLPPPGYE